MRHIICWEYVTFPLHGQGPAVQLPTPADVSPARALYLDRDTLSCRRGRGIAAGGAPWALNGKAASMA